MLSRILLAASLSPIVIHIPMYTLLVGVRILKFSLVHHIAMILLCFPAFSAANCRSSLHSALQSSSSPEPCPGHHAMPRAQLLESPQVESNVWPAQSHDSSFLVADLPYLPYIYSVELLYNTSTGTSLYPKYENN